MRCPCASYCKADAGAVVADAIIFATATAVAIAATAAAAATLRCDKLARAVKIAVEVAVCERSRRC